VFAVNVRGLFQVTGRLRHFCVLIKVVSSIRPSIVGLRPGPQPSPYAASKAAVIKPHQERSPESRAGDRVNAWRPAGWKATG